MTTLAAPLPGFILLGGIPAERDFSPSILFLVLYAMLLVLFIYRMAMKESRDWILLRPGLFVGIRIAGFVMRALQSKGNYSETIFVISAVFLLVGYVFLAEAFIFAFNRYVHLNAPPCHLINRVGTMLHIAIFSAIITGAAAGAMISQVIQNPNSNTAKTVKGLRLANYVVSIVVSFFLCAATMYSHARFGGTTKQTAFLLSGSACLFVVALYRCLQAELSTSAPWIHTDSCFWILNITLEFVATVLVIGVRFPVLFPKIRKDQGTNSSSSHKFRGMNKSKSDGSEFAV